LRLIASSVLGGSSAIPVWARGTREFFGRGYPFSLRKAARSVPFAAGGSSLCIIVEPTQQHQASGDAAIEELEYGKRIAFKLVRRAPPRSQIVEHSIGDGVSLLGLGPGFAAPPFVGRTRFQLLHFRYWGLSPAKPFPKDTPPASIAASFEVAPEVAVPGVLVLVDATLGDRLVQYLEPFLALAAADDLADPRRQYVHRRDCPAVVINRMYKALTPFG
jgi:hypothetical protein